MADDQTPTRPDAGAQATVVNPTLPSEGDAIAVRVRAPGMSTLAGAPPPESYHATAPSLGRHEVATFAAAPPSALIAASQVAPSIGPGAHAGALLAGKYRLLRVLGAGGMGEVYYGEHLTLGVPIAVKLLHAHVAAHPDHLRRFRREAHAVSRLHHPNVVRVLDFDEDPKRGLFYIVMEFLEGRSVASWLHGLAAPPPLAEVAWILRALFDAFAAAHAVGIVHRDLKPDNIFLANTSGGGRLLKVLDFGLAHVEGAPDAGPTLTRAGMIAGTPEYMSPEQCESLAVGPSSDLYAIGCVLTELLQLAPPFTGTTAIEVLSQQLFMPPPPLARGEGAEPIPPLLERLRLDLLAKAPANRPRDVAEARARFEEALSPEATAARLPARKGDEPLGGRNERLPTWEGAPAADRTTLVSPLPAASTTKQVALVRLAGGEGGVSSLCLAGLAAQGIVVREGAATGAPLAVIDAGDDVAGACAWLATLRPPTRALVCAAAPTAEQMNQLIAAGAADVATYPITADALGKKIDRALRRRR